MQELIEKILYYGILIVLLFLLMAVITADESWGADYSQHKELYMANEAEGWIVLTLEDCKLGDKIKKDFPSRAYATESDGTMHEGCWDAPSTADAPAVDPAIITIIPIVNVLWHTGDLTAYPQNAFSPTKTKRLENAI